MWPIKSFPVLFVCLNNCAVLQQQLFLSKCCVSECLATCPSGGRASSTGTINLRSSSDGIGYAEGHGVCRVRHGADVTRRGHWGHGTAGQCNSVPKDAGTATPVCLDAFDGLFPFFFVTSFSYKLAFFTPIPLFISLPCLHLSSRFPCFIFPFFLYFFKTIFI